MSHRAPHIAKFAEEFPVLHSADESVPFAQGESENLVPRVFAVADADIPAGQVGDLDAAAVGETERTLDPTPVRVDSAGSALIGRGSTHVATSPNVV